MESLGSRNEQLIGISAVPTQSSTATIESEPDQRHASTDVLEVRVPEVQNAWEYLLYNGHVDDALDFSSDSSANHPTPRRARTRLVSGGLNTDTSEDELLAAEVNFPHGFRRRRNRRLSKPSGAYDFKSQSIGSDDASSDVVVSRSRNKRRVERSRRSVNKERPDYTKVWDVDESDDGSTSVLGKRKRGQYAASPRPGTRRSGRSKRLLNMREYQDDEIEEVEARRPGPPKAVGARESFVELAINDHFRSCHNQTCHTCNEEGHSAEKGPLVYCQGCTFAYHRKCLGNRNSREHLVTKVTPDEFVLQCRRCIEVAVSKNSRASKQGHCQKCRELGPMSVPLKEKQSSKKEQKAREENDGEDPITEVPPERLNNKLNVLFRCMSCCMASHIHHLPRNGERGSNADYPVDTQRDKSLEDMSAEELYDMQVAVYRRTWKCEHCASSPDGIDAIVAWRPTDTKLYYTQNIDYEQLSEDEKEYLIKWRSMSYSQCTWMPGSWAWGVVSPAMRKAFDRKNKTPEFSFESAVPEEYLRIDIILDVEYTSIVKMRSETVDKARMKEVERVLVKFKGLGYEDAAWEKPPREVEAERWSDFTAAYEDWVLGRHTHLPKPSALKAHLEKIRSQNFKTVELKEQPETLVGGKLMGYQLEGLNWLYYKWHTMQNAILADEMGLGKTIQVIGFLATLQVRHGCWPFLVVVPNSTCSNWRREIKQWAPSLRVVTYFGSAEAKRLSARHELFPDGGKDLHCHVVVTSYDAAEDPNFRTIFRSVSWAGLVVDEGQRLKSDKNILYSVLGSLNVPFKVLLTGTPLQNNQRELFNLLQFLDKSIDAAALEEEYEDLDREAIIEIHGLLRPYFLRRTKAQVLKHLPPMAQIIVPVTMTLVQRKLYKSILAKNQELIKAIFGAGPKLKQTEKSNLNNILMQLRKCLCHPFVYSREIEEKTDNLALSHRNLVEASAKLRLLEIMLPKLQERGHRVLIFSQFLDMLDMVEDFLDGLGMFYERLDGSMNSLQKQKRIDEYNASDSPLFAFLLSTRSGGVGINLATADTVIILDPDFNPHQDIQALSRAHRIGQEKKVLVFQCMTRDSVEEKIVQMGKKKMLLDHVLIDQMDEGDNDNVDLETILRHGAEALFQDEAADITYDSASVNKLLDRSSYEDTKTGKDASADSQFSFARIWANDKGDMNGNLGDENADTKPIDPSLWDKILKEREEEVAREAAARAEALGRGKRRRTNVDYARELVEEGPGLELSPAEPRRGRKPKEGSGSDTDFQAQVDGSDSDDIASDPDQVHGNELEHLRSKTMHQPSQDRAFRRVELPSPSAHFQMPVMPLQKVTVASPMATGIAPQPILPSQPLSQMPSNASIQHASPCLACDNRHPVGYCPLKLAGVEYCGLCGLAHYGHGRTCPHLTSVTQCRQMLASLRQSQEPPHLVKTAKRYVVGVIADLERRKKEAKAKEERIAAGELPNGTPHPAPINGYAMEARVVAGQGPDGQARQIYADGKGNLFLPRPHPSTNAQTSGVLNGEQNGFTRITNEVPGVAANGDRST